MDAPQLNGLLVARGLLDRAVLSRDGTAPGEVTALVLLDLAVESGAKAILGTRVERGASFRTTIKLLNEEHRKGGASAEDLDGTSRVHELRDLRNGVQHAGNTPAAEDVERYRVYAEDFLDAATRSLVGVALRDLSSGSLLRQEEVRESVDRAEHALGRGDVQEAARELAIGFAEVVHRFRSSQPWRRRGRLDHHEVRRAAEALSPKRQKSGLANKLRDALAAAPTKRPLSAYEARDIAEAALAPGLGDTRPLIKVLQDLTTEVEFIAERVEAAMVVGDAGEHAWFRARVGKATPVGGPREYSYVPPEPPLDGREVRRAIAFVVSAALRQQLLEESPPAEGSSAARIAREREAWEQLKDGIVGLAEQHEDGTVLIDDVVRVLGVDDTARVEPAISELLEEGRLVRVAEEAFALPEAP